MADTDPQPIWTDGENETPVCRYTRTDLVNQVGPFPPGHNPRPSQLPANQFGILTGEHPALAFGYLTLEGAQQLVSSLTWNVALSEGQSLSYPEWATATLYDEIGAVIQHLGMCYQVIQSHTSQIGWEPNNVPALFRMHDPSYSTMPWAQPAGAHDAYQIGRKVTHSGSSWENNTADNVWEPGVFGWVAEVGPVPEDEWIVGFNYALGNEATFSTVMYRCIQPHGSQSDWTPPATPALWAVV